MRELVDNSASDSQLLHVSLSDLEVDEVVNTHLDFPMALFPLLVISFKICFTDDQSLPRRKFQVANTLSLPRSLAERSCNLPDADTELPLRPADSD
jgi:hypothetical protein